MGSTLAISRSAADEILAHAASSPLEVCGLLLGDERICAAVACANVHPIPSRSFEIDPAALIAAHRRARDGGPRILGYYHSHPSGEPSPSAVDAASAAADGLVWVIVADGAVRAWRAVRDGAVQGRFDPVRLVEDAACA